MVFELVEKFRNSYSLKDSEVSVSGMTIRFADSFNNLIKNLRLIEIYFDKPNHLIGFKFTKKSINGFSTQWLSNGHSYHISSERITKEIPKGRYKLKKQGDLWITQLPKK